MRIVFGRIGGLVLGLMLLAAAVLPATGADSRVRYSNGRSNGYSNGRSSGYSNGRSYGYSNGRSNAYSNGQQYSYHAHQRHHTFLHLRWHPHGLWHHRH